MANKKISELITTTDIKNQDIIPIVQDGTTKKISYGNLREISISPTTPTSNESVWIRKGKNLINLKTVNIGNYTYDDSGNIIINNTNYICIEKIKVQPNTTYVFSGNIDNTKYTQRRYVSFNSSGKFISRSGATASDTGDIENYSFTTSDNTYYVGILIFTSSVASIEDISNVQLEAGTTATEYKEFVEEKFLIKNNAGQFEEYSDVVVSPVMPAQGKVWIKNGRNLFNVNASSKNTGLGYDSGVTNTSSSSNTSGFIKVEANNTYIFSYNYETLQNEGNRAVCYYDENKTYLSGTLYAPTSKQVAITPTQDGYVRMSYDINCINIMFEQNSTPTDYEDYIEKEIYVKNDNGVFERFYSESEMNKQNYSTEEQIIGTWINGKPLYRKVINYGALPNATTRNMEHGISNPFFTKIYGVSYGLNVFLPLPYADDVNVTNTVLLRAASTGITIRTGIDRSNFTETYVILEYTKTTD